jgi:hypothetical protein
MTSAASARAENRMQETRGDTWSRPARVVAALRVALHVGIRSGRAFCSPSHILRDPAGAIPRSRGREFRWTHTDVA